MKLIANLSILFCSLFVGLSCTSISLEESLDDYGPYIDRLEQAIRADSLDGESLRDLGEIYLKTGHPDKANAYLVAATKSGLSGGKTRFLLALSHESMGEVEKAVELYGSYHEVSRLSPYRSRMEGRYTWLAAEAARSEIARRIADEANLAQEELSSDVVAVFPFAGEWADKRYSPLGRGLSEMLTIDLGQIDQLQVVERVRLQALLDELALVETGMVDPETAPRLGQLLLAGTVVAGNFNVTAENNLLLTAALVEAETSKTDQSATQSGSLSEFFQLEKRLVFDLVSRLGIELTEAETTRIERIPTQNLQSFLAFCRGLLAEDERDYQAATAYFDQAEILDPGFDLGREAKERAENAGLVSGVEADLLIGLTGLGGSFDAKTELVESRLGRLGEGVKSPFVPGAESRKAATESTILAEPNLPDPPTPPGGN